MLIFQGQIRVETNWFKTYIGDIVSDMGGLFVSIIGTVSFILSGYQEFVQDKSMLKQLYAEERKNLPPVKILNEQSSDRDNQYTHIKEKFRAKLERRKDFRMKYSAYLLSYLVEHLCCCFMSCCRKPSRCKRMIDSYKKF